MVQRLKVLTQGIFISSLSKFFGTNSTGSVELAKQSEVESLKTSVSSGKAQIASAITDKGVSTSSSASFSTMASNIRQIENGAKIEYFTVRWNTWNDFSVRTVTLTSFSSAEITKAIGVRSYSEGNAIGAIYLDDKNFVRAAGHSSSVYGTVSANGHTFSLTPQFGLIGGWSFSFAIIADSTRSQIF